MNFIQKNLFNLLVVALMLIVPIFSFAQPISGTPSDIGKIVNPLSTDSIPELIKTILEGVIKLGVPVIALAIIYSGFLFVAARGNPEKITKAKDTLIYTLIGAALLLGSWALAQLITETVLAL